MGLIVCWNLGWEAQVGLTAVGQKNSSDDIDERGDDESESSNKAMLPVVAGHGDSHQMGGAGDEEDVGDDIVVVC